MPRIFFVIITAFGFAMSNSHADLPKPNVAAFNVDGLTLSMSVDEFRQLSPEAQFIEQTAARYCYGEEVNIDSLSRLDAIVRRGEATVHITFDYKFFGQRISQIKSVEVIEFDPSRFTSLRDRLVRLYGPITGMKYPHKMDPAGLIVGFEWEQRGVAYLSVTIHRDHASESDPNRQTTFLTRSLPDLEDQRKAAAYYRDAVHNFRENCARR